MRSGIAAAAGCFALAFANPVGAACVVHYFATMPVSLAADGVTTSAVINGHAMDVVVNSGAFYSFMSRDAANAINVDMKPISPSFGFYRVRDGGKDSVDAKLGYLDELKFGKGSIANAHFIVIGGRGAPQTATLGQNILAIRDAEFDLQGGLVRLATPEGCTGKDMAYWAQPVRVMSVPMEPPEGELGRQNVGRVSVNGVPLRAVFSTGSARTAISSRALAKLGRAKDADSLDSIKLATLGIGGEERRDVEVEVVHGDMIREVDVIVGLDFFLTHRVYVSNGRKTIYFSANDGAAPTAASGTP